MTSKWSLEAVMILINMMLTVIGPITVSLGMSQHNQLRQLLDHWFNQACELCGAEQLCKKLGHEEWCYKDVINVCFKFGDRATPSYCFVAANCEMWVGFGMS